MWYFCDVISRGLRAGGRVMSWLGSDGMLSAMVSIGLSRAPRMPVGFLVRFFFLRLTMVLDVICDGVGCVICDGV